VLPSIVFADAISLMVCGLQGKMAVVRRFTRSTFVCDSDHFVPAVFWPPRDGANDSRPRNLGRRLPPLVVPVQLPSPVEPAQQQPAWMPVPVEAS
jgi:hypothetical protein